MLKDDLDQPYLLRLPSCDLFPPFGYHSTQACFTPLPRSMRGGGGSGKLRSSVGCPIVLAGGVQEDHDAI